MASPLVPILTPHGYLLLAPDEDATVLAEALQRRRTQSFARGAGHGLLQLGAGEVGTALPPALGYWRDFGARYVGIEGESIRARSLNRLPARRNSVLEPAANRAQCTL